MQKPPNELCIQEGAGPRAFLPHYALENAKRIQDHDVVVAGRRNSLALGGKSLALYIHSKVSACYVAT